MYTDTKIEPFTLLNQASVNVTAALTANVNTYALSYPTACVGANRPSNCYEIVSGSGRNAFILQLLLQDLAGDVVDNTTGILSVWGWPSSYYSAGVLLLTAEVRSGATYIGTASAPGLSPADGTALTGQWGYVDTLTITANNIDAWTVPLLDAADMACANDAILQLLVDPRGMKYLFADWDLDAGSGIAANDAMAIIRPY